MSLDPLDADQLRNLNNQPPRVCCTVHTDGQSGQEGIFNGLLAELGYLLANRPFIAILMVDLSDPPERSRSTRRGSRRQAELRANADADPCRRDPPHSR